MCLDTLLTKIDNRISSTNGNHNELNQTLTGLKLKFFF